MKKIDLHIHTVASISDSEFTFSIEKLKGYVENAKLDAIAITNHNLFDIQQFETIKEEISAKVFPGIEINLEGGHILLISDGDDLADFHMKCQQVTKKIQSPTDRIDIDELKAIFGDLNDYVLIPHWGKKPKLNNEILKELNGFITAGEVDSPKKFIRAKKNEASLVPVYFSDTRISKDLENFSVRQTFVDCSDVNINSIKTCFSDREKVALSENDGNNLFQIFDNGQMLSTGLNVILGERSSGKTFTLDRINREQENVKYIKQFELVQNDDEESFNKFINKQHSLVTEEYLKEFNAVLTDIISVDIKANEKQFDEYLESLLASASEEEKKDTFSKAALFDETEFKIDSLNPLQQLIAAVIHLIQNGAYKELIEKHLNKESLKDLAIELIDTIRAKSLTEKKKKNANEVISVIKQGLSLQTSATQIKSIDLYDYKIKKRKVERFNEITKNLQRESIIQEENLQGFKVISSKKKFSLAGEIKKVSGTTTAFSGAFKAYDDPYKYLQELKQIETLTQSEFYKYFVKIEYKIINKDGYEVSGGERSEFKLLHEIKDAQNFDYLLIDEPESSFDNIFLKSEVNKIIKDISKNMPVVVVTHNSTVGASIMADYLIYTCKENDKGCLKYEIYSGYPADKELLSIDGKKKVNFDLTINSLEGGEAAYLDRKTSYDNLK